MPARNPCSCLALTPPPPPPQGSAFERALQQMMDGSLQAAGSAERELGQAPAWMAGDPKGFSEEQLRQWREWQATEKAYVEEKVKRQGGSHGHLAAGCFGSMDSLSDRKQKLLTPATCRPALRRPAGGGAALAQGLPGGGVRPL